MIKNNITVYEKKNDNSSYYIFFEILFFIVILLCFILYLYYKGKFNIFTNDNKNVNYSDINSFQSLDNGIELNIMNSKLLM